MGDTGEKRGGRKTAPNRQHCQKMFSCPLIHLVNGRCLCPNQERGYFLVFVSVGDGRKGEETFLTTSIAYLPLLSTPTRRMTGKYIYRGQDSNCLEESRGEKGGVAHARVASRQKGRGEEMGRGGREILLVITVGSCDRKRGSRSKGEKKYKKGLLLASPFMGQQKRDKNENERWKKISWELCVLQTLTRIGITHEDYS